jgi:photosystem II stability/assembly factor-like uncharacterized protein
MQEQEISDRIHAAFDVQPLPGGFDRLRVALESATAASKPRAKSLSLRRFAPLVALFMAVVVTASAIAYGIESRIAPAKNPSRPVAVLPIDKYWFYSAADAAVQLAPPAGGWQPDLAPVLITHDGGASWIRTPLNLPLIGLQWIDSLHIVAMMNNVGPLTVIEVTSDGGVTWRSTLVPSGFYLPNHFVNETDGWAVCNHSQQGCPDGSQAPVLYHTVDSGATWRASRIAGPAGVTPIDVYFVEGRHGFLSTASPLDVPKLLVTVDGGNSWQVADLPIPTGSAASATTYCPESSCADLPEMFGAQGVVTAASANGGVYTCTTGDGGQTWGNPHRLPATFTPSMSAAWFQALDPINWWAVDAAGAVYRTQDAGLTWRLVPVSLPDGDTLESVLPGPGGVLWGATTHGGIEGYQYPLRSTDGGHSWSLVKLPKP